MACALLYNFKDAARLQKVRFALFKLGVSGRVVAPEELSQPIGYLCDLEGFSPVEETVEGGFSDEMLVLCGLSGPQLDALLSSLRRSRVVTSSLLPCIISPILTLAYSVNFCYHIRM